MSATVVAVVAAYLIGGLPFGYWLVRRSRGLDLRRVGSHNPGATNALRVAGAWNGLATLALDVLKGFVAIELARALGVAPAALGLVALAAVVGHTFPVWLRFRGGKGVATATGAYATLAPVPLAWALAVFLAVLAAGRVVALGSIAAAVAVPAAMFGLDRWGGSAPAYENLAPWATTIALLVVARHWSNLGRLWEQWSAGAREQEES